jgi:hypothetical protein
MHHCVDTPLPQALWGDWCYLPKEKRVVRGSKARAAAGGRSAPRSMFEQFALEPIWRAYSVCEPEGEGVQVRGGVFSIRQHFAVCSTLQTHASVGYELQSKPLCQDIECHVPSSYARTGV